MEGKTFGYLCILLGIVAGVCAGPVNVQEATCAKECRVDQNTLNYEVGKTYVYQYEADSVTTLQGASDEHSSLHIRATAEIEVLAPCELVLSLRDVTLENSDPRDLSRLRASDNQRDFKNALESRPLRFAFQNGRVDAICAADDEQQWTLNIKRGVLSAVQNSMSHLEVDEKVQETDVAGDCEAEYRVSNKGWNSITITKSKNLLGCTGRTNAITTLQSTPYSASSDIQSLPLMKSEHSCEQTISKSGLLQKSECQENHVFRPFSNKGSGAATTVRQMLQYSKEYGYIQSRNAPADRRTTLTYEHEGSSDTADRNAQRVMEKLQQICSIEDVRPETPRLFSELVYAMKALNTYSLQTIHNRVETNRMCSQNHDMAKRFFHDALPAMSTTASVSLMQKLIVSKEITGTEADMWLTSLAFIAQPTQQMLVEIKPLLNLPKALLSVSSMVHSFCKNFGDCETNIDVRDIVRTLTEELGYNCQGDRQTMLLTLKALGNIGVSAGAVDTITRCTNQASPVDVRLAAINSFRRLDCAQNRMELRNIFVNMEEDSEVRIAAYLSLMQCPSEELVALIKDKLDSEEVNQVGSFVWTHLTNLQESAGNFKKEVRKILEDETLKKTFNTDARKYSRNYEGSFFFDSLNTGAMVESNLVWSPKSFVPRSANLNLTIDLFGQSMNLFEWGGRVEGLESYLEAFFGPNGYFPDNAVSDALKKQKKAANNRLSSINDKYNANMDELRGSAYMRIFGNELAFWDYSGSGKRGEKEQFNFLEFLIKLAQDHQMEYTKSFMFLDSEVHIPTVIGMPLKLSVNGTATIDLKVGGKMDIRKAGASPSSFDINGYVKPSGAVEISGVMTMDATVARSGLKMVTTLHSSTEMDGQLQLKDSKAFNIKFNMPKEKMEILNVQTQFFIMDRDQEREQSMPNTPRVQKNMCTCNGLTTLLGVQLCGDVSYPGRGSQEETPYFPFNGPLNASLALYRRDTHQSYEFEARVEAKKERLNGVVGYTNIARLAFNTPGSQVDRELLLDFNLNKLAKTLNAEVRSPWKRASATGALVTDADAKRLTFTADMDGEQMISVTGDLQQETVANGRRYMPTAEVRLPGRKPINARASLSFQPGKEYDADFSLDNVFDTTVAVKGKVEQKGSKDEVRFDTEFEVQTPVFNTKMKGFVENKKTLARSRLEFGYDFASKTTHSFVLNGKFRDQSKKNNLQYSSVFAVQSSQFPDYQFDIDANMKKTNRHFENKIEIQYGADSKDYSKRIAFSQEANLVQGDELQADHSMSLKIKPLSIIMTSRIEHSHSMNELKTKGMFSYTPGKEISVDLGLKRDTNDLMKMNGNLLVTIPNREIKLMTNLEETQVDTFNHEMTAQWRSDAQFRTMTTYSRVLSQGRHEFRSEIFPPTNEAITVTGLTVLDVKDFQAKFQADLNEKSYGAGINYNFDLKKDVSIGVNLDAYCPARHISFDAKIDGSKNVYRLKSNTQWDADRDSTKQVTVVGTMDNLESANLKVNYPGRKITLNLKQKMDQSKFNAHGDLSWDVGSSITFDADYNYKFGYNSKALQGSIALDTPFKFARELKLAIDHNNDLTDSSSKLDITYAPSKTITTLIVGKRVNGWRQMENKLTLTTPFVALSTFSLATTHEIADTEMNVNVAIARNQNIVNIDLLAKNEAFSNIEMRASLKSNLPRMTSASLHMTHVARNQQMQSRLSGDWEGEVVTLTVNGKNQGYSGKRDLEGKIIFTSPFSSMREISIGGSHNDDGRTFETAMETTWAPNKKVSVTLNMANSDKGDWRIQNSGSLTVHTPFASAERINAQWNQNFDHGRIVSSNILQWNREKLSLSIDNTYTISTTRDIVSNIAFESTFSNPRDASLNIRYNIGSSSLKGTIGVNHNGANDITLNVDLSHQQFRNFAGKVTTSSSYFTTVTTDVDVQTLTMPYTSHFEMTYDSKKISLDTQTTYNGFELIKGEIRLVSPFRQFERVVVNVDHIRQGQVWNSKASVAYLSKTFAVETAFETEGERLTKANVNLFTPFEQLKSFRWNINHSSNELQGNSVINYNDLHTLESSYMYRGALASEVRVYYNGIMGFNARHTYDGATFDLTSEIQLSRDDKIALSSKLSQEALTLNLQTPYAALQSADLSVNHDGDIRRFSNSVFASVKTIPGKIKIVSKLRASGLNYIDGQMDFTSPFESFESISMSVSHKNRRSQVTTSASVDYPYQKKIEMNGQYDKTTYEGSVSLKTPYYDDIILSGGFFNGNAKASLQYAADKTIDIRASMQADDKVAYDFMVTSPSQWLKSLSARFEHAGPINDFATRAVLNYDRFGGAIDSNVAFKIQEADIETSASIKTPFQSFRDASLRLSNKAVGWKKYESAISSSFQSSNVFDMKSTVKIGSLESFNGDVSLSTMFQEVRSAALTFGHTGSFSRFANNAKFTLNRDQYSYEGNFVADSTISGNFKANDLALTFNHNGDPRNMRSAAKATYGRGKTISTSATFRFDGDLDAKVEFTAPFSRDVVATISHTGPIDSFRHVTQVSYGGERTIITGIFQLKPTIVGQFKLESPFAEDVEASYTHSGYAKAFQTTGFVRLGDKTVEATADVDVRSGITTKLTFNSPFPRFETITFDMSHAGSMAPFTFATKAGLTYAPSKTVSASANAKVVSGAVDAHFKISSPCPVVRDSEINLVYNNQGTPLDFQVDIDASVNSEKKIVAHADMQTRGQISGNLRLETPIPGAESTTLIFSHKGDVSDFETNVVMSYAHGEMRGDVTFNDSPVSATLALRTPYTSMKEATLTASHSGNGYGFNTEASFRHNLLGAFTYNGQFTTRNNIKGEFTVNTPFQGYENMYSRFSHWTQTPGFSSAAEMGIGEKVVKANAELTVDSNIQATATLQTPFTPVKDFVITLTHDGGLRNFQTTMQVDLNRERQVEAQGSLNTDTTINGNFNIISKFGRHRVTFRHSGDINSTVETSGMISYPGGEINGDLNLQIRPELDGTFHLKSTIPYLRDMTIVAKHGGYSGSSFTSELTFSHDILGRLTYSGTLRTNPSINGLFTIETPFPAIRNMNLKFGHNSDSSKVQTNAEATYNGMTYSAAGDLKFNPSVDGSLRIYTPHTMLRDFSLVVSHNGDMNEFKNNFGLTYNRQQIAQAEGSWTRNPIQASISVSTQSDYLRSLQLKASSRGSSADRQTSASVNYNGQQIANGEMSLKSNPAVQGTLQINTVWSNINDLFVSVNHNGDMSAFNCNGQVRYNNEHTFEGTAEFSQAPLKGKITLNTPFQTVRDLSAAFSHDGNFDRFQTHAEFSHASNKYEVDGSFQSSPLKFTCGIKTPFEGARNLNAMFKHKGDMEKFSTHAETSLDGYQWQVDTTFQRLPLEVNVDVRTPLGGYRKMNAAITQTGNTAHAELSCGRNKIEADGFLQLQPLNANIVLKTPFRGAKKLNAAVKHNGDLSAFQSHAEAGWETGRVSVDAAFSKYPLQGSFNIQLPIRGANKINLAFNREGKNGHIEGSCDYAKIEVDGSFQPEPLEANIHVQTPWEGAHNLKAALRHNGNQAHAEASYDNGKFEADGSLEISPFRAELNVKTPFQGFTNMFATLKHDGDRNALQTNAEASYDNGKFEAAGTFQRRPLNVQLNVKTPFDGARNVNAAFNHRAYRGTFNSHYETSFDYGKYEADTSLTIDPLTYELSIKTPHAGYTNINAILTHTGDLEAFETHGEATYDYGKIEADGSFRQFPLEAKFGLKTPFPAARDVNAFVSHSGDAEAFQTLVEGNVNNQKAEAKAIFTRQPMQASFTMKTPFDYARDIQATVKHEGDMSGFETKAVVGNEKGKFEILANAQRRPLGAKLTINTPIQGYEQMGLELSHKGTMNKAFRSQASVNYQAGKTISLEAQYKNLGRLVGNVQLTTPFRGYESIGASVRHDGDMDGLRSKAELTFGSKTLSGDVDLKFQPNVQGTVQLKSPLSGLEEVNINVHHKLDASSVDSKVSLSTPSGEINVAVNGQYTNLLDMSGSMSVSSPIKSVSVSGKTHGSPSNIRAEIQATSDGKVMSMSADVQTTQGLKVNVVVNTSFAGYEELTFNLDHQGTIGQFETSAALKNGRRAITASAQIQTDRQIVFSANVQTPFRSLSQASVSLNHAGSIQRFRTNVRFTCNNQKPMTAGVTFVNDRQFQMNFDLSCPYVEGVSLTMNHEGLISRFNSQASLKNGRDESTVKVDFQMVEGVTLKTEITSPYMEAPINVELTHEGNMNAFTTKASANAIRADVTWTSNNNYLSLKAGIESPAFERIDTVFTLNGNMANLQANADISYSRNQKISTNIVYNSNNGIPVIVEATFTSPFKNAENLALDLKNTISYGKFSSRGSFSWATRQAINIQTVGRYAGSLTDLSISGFLKVKTPFTAVRSMVLNLNHAHRANSLTSKIDMGVNGQDILDAEVQLSPSSGSLISRQPHPATASYEVQGDNSNIAVNWNTASRDSNIRMEVTNKDESSYYRTNRVLAVRTITPTRTMSLSADLDWSKQTFIQKTALIWDASQEREFSYEINLNDRSRRGQNICDGSVRLNTPVRSFEVQGSHNDDSRTFTTKATLKWDAARDETRMLTLSNTYQTIGNEHVAQITIAHPSLNKDISLRNSFTLNDDKIMFSGRTEIEYSDNADETIVLSANVENKDSNYTMTLNIAHPVNAIDVGIIGNGANTRDVMTAGLNMRYMNARRQTEMYRLLGQIEKLRKSLKMELDSPMKKLEVFGKVTPTSDGYSGNLVAKEDNEEKMSATINVGKNSMNLEAHLNPEKPENLLHISGEYQSPVNMKMDVYRHIDGSPISDTNVAFDLKNRRLLHSRVYLRPGMTDDVLASAADTAFRANRKLALVWEQASNKVQEEYRQKAYIIQRNLPNMTPVTDYLTAEAASFRRDAQAIERAWTRMYYNNEFYVRSIESAAKSTAEALSEFCAQQMGKIRTCLQRVATTMSEKTAAIRLWCAEICNNLTANALLMSQAVSDQAAVVYETMMGQYAVVNHAFLIKYNSAQAWAKNQTDIMKVKAVAALERAMEVIAPYAEAYIRYYNHATKWINANKERIAQKAEELAAKIPYEKIEAVLEYASRRLSQIQILAETAFQQYLKVYGGFLEKISEYDFLRPIYNVHLEVVEKVEGLLAALQAASDRPVQTARLVLIRSTRIASQISAEIMANINQEYVANFAQDIIDKTRWAYNHYEIEKNVLGAVKGLASSGVRFVKDNAFYLVNDYLGLEKDRLIAYNPRGGELEFELYVPTDLPSLTHVPVEGVTGLYNSLKKAAGELKAAITAPTDFNMWDMYYQYKPDSNPANWVPPFSAYAAISGDQHIMTFDKKFYEFAGSCSYVLASDFIDGNFSVIANFKNGARKSITVVSNDQDIEIGADVNVNGEDTELPYEYLNTTVLRSGDVIRLDNTKGLTVICDLQQDFCSVAISGWYFGKTAGLMGTFNNEPSDDFMTSDRQLTSSVEVFAQSWAVGNCRDRTNYAVEAELLGVEGTECSKFFMQRGSTLRNCFKVVRPEPFFRMCSAAERRRAPGAECKVAGFYRAVCARAGVEVDMPARCSRCDKPGTGEFAGEEMLTLTRPPQSADVVFVVEEKPCNADAVSRLSSLGNKIDIELHNLGLKNNHFGLVGFGGAGIHANVHSHTVGGHLLDDSRIRQAVLSLQLEGEGESDAFSAVKFAAAYPFRAGVSKTIVLVTCGTCQEVETSYDDLEEILDDLSITLHVLTEHDFQMEGNSQSPKTNYLFGVDAQTAFTVRHVSDKELAGDPALFAKLAEPESTCSDMAQETGGSFFNIKKLTEGRVRFQKSFADIFSRRVAKTAVPASCQVCECQAQKNGVGMSVCRPCIEDNPAKQVMLESKLVVPNEDNTAPGRKVKKTRALRLRKTKRARSS